MKDGKIKVYLYKFNGEEEYFASANTPDKFPTCSVVGTAILEKGKYIEEDLIQEQMMDCYQFGTVGVNNGITNQTDG